MEHIEFICPRCLLRTRVPALAISSMRPGQVINCYCCGLTLSPFDRVGEFGYTDRMRDRWPPITQGVGASTPDTTNASGAVNNKLLLLGEVK